MPAPVLKQVQSLCLPLPIALAALCCLVCPGERVSAADLPVERRLNDFTNADGRTPDGKGGDFDDSTALNKALGAGPGTVRIGPGVYRLGGVTIPSDVSLVGAGPATVIRSSGPAQIFVQTGVHGWALRDVVLDGQAAGDWHGRKDAGQSGLVAERCSGWEITGVTLKDFDGAALQLTRTDLGRAAFSNGGVLDRVTASGSYAGIRFDVRAEYIIATKLNCHRNLIGCVIHGGNCNISASNFGSNRDGMLIQDKENGSHGSISNCLLNHNERFALQARQVENGMAISNCCFFYGQIELDQCTGVSLNSGIISCGVSVTGPGANRVAGNYIVPERYRFSFAPATLVRDNYTRSGTWDSNSPDKSPPAP